jgi:hypothetical protein
MTLHSCIVRPGIRTSAKVARLSWFHRDFFHGLLAVGQGDEGWFEANETLLRAALYAPCLGKVSERDLRDGLRKLQEVGVIKLWTGRNGRGYGLIVNYRQKYSYGVALPKDAREPSDELPFEAQPPEVADPPPKPAPAINPANRVEGSGEETAPAPHGKKGSETQDAWLERLQREHAHVEVTAQFRAWGVWCRRQNKRPDRYHFERQWLAQIGEAVELDGHGRTPGAGPVQREPEAWRLYLKDRYEGEEWAETAQCMEWSALPPNWRGKISREMQGRKQ